MQVIEQGGLGLIDVGGVFGHLHLQRLAIDLVELIGVELLLQILGHVSHCLGIDRVVLGAE